MAKYHYKYRRPQRRHFPFKKLLWCLVALLLVVYPFFEATTLTVEEHTLYVTDLPTNLKNLKIVFASDIHQCAWFPTAWAHRARRCGCLRRRRFTSSRSRADRFPWGMKFACFYKNA